MTEVDDNPYLAPSAISLVDEAVVPAPPVDAELAFLRRERKGYALTVGILSLGGGVIAGLMTLATLTALLSLRFDDSTPRGMIALGFAASFTASFLVGGVAACRNRNWGLALSSAAWLAWTGLLLLVALGIGLSSDHYVTLDPPVVMLLCVMALPGVLAALSAHTAWRVGKKVLRREATLAAASGAGPRPS